MSGLVVFQMSRLATNYGFTVIAGNQKVNKSKGGFSHVGLNPLMWLLQVKLDYHTIHHVTVY